LSDVVCALLITLGVGTRWLAAFCFVDIFVAFALVHHFTFTGKSPDADHGELIVQYLIALAALIIGGPGRYSIDGMLADK
jgi:putative oxidoreductase